MVPSSTSKSSSSSSSRMFGRQCCLSWMALYWLALGVAVLLNTYSDVVFLLKQPYSIYYNNNNKDGVGDDDYDAPWKTIQKQPRQQQHASTSSIDSKPLVQTQTRSTTMTNNINDNNNSSNAILEILSCRRNAFYQNTTLRAMLQTISDCHGKEELLSILYAAKTTTTKATTPESHNDVVQFLLDSCAKLAPWKQVTELYGSKPIIVGMETCATYRKMLQQQTTSTTAAAAPRVRVAGLYNSGTTALAHALVDNLPYTHGASATAAGSNLDEQIRLLQLLQQSNNNNNSSNNTIISPGVPWGKHLPYQYKYINTFPIDNMDDPDFVLPIVIVRDPYRWMQSMCKTAYDAEWTLIPQHCPNLVPTANELKVVNDSSLFDATTILSSNDKNYKKFATYNRKTKTYKVNVTYEMAEPHLQYSDVYPSLADWWSEWISSYVDSSAPRLLIRFEDLLFHAEYVMSQIIECAHGSSIEASSSSWLSLLKPYDYKLTKAKTHGRSTDFIGAILKYARQDTKRSGGMTPQDLAFARGGGGDSDNNVGGGSHNKTTAPLYPKLMQMFSYTHPPANTPFRIQYRLIQARVKQ